jgi:hypothetical protein
MAVSLSEHGYRLFLGALLLWISMGVLFIAYLSVRYWFVALVVLGLAGISYSIGTVAIKKWK